MILKVLIGLPGCGKSSYGLDKDDFVLHSSDDIRAELSLEETECVITFQTMLNRTITDLRSGKNVIYDATNLTMKNRINLLKSIDNSVKGECKKVAVLFVVPVEVCLARNAARTRVVPEAVYDIMLRSFEVPMLGEGFDEIEVVYSGFDGTVNKIELEDLQDFDQCNHHHALSLGGHMQKAWEYVQGQSADIIETMKWHDIGKYFTKRFENAKGEPTAEAHYYGHDKYGSYIYMVYQKVDNPERDVNEVLHIASLINWHMAPYIRWKNSQRYEKDVKIFGMDFIKKIEIIHEADVKAH